MAIIHKIFFALCLALTLASCSDTIDISQHGKSKLVLYAFASASDTISITVSLCQPTGQVKAVSHTLSHVQVKCTTNGQEDMIVLADSGKCYAIGKHHAGDKISVTVSAQIGNSTEEAWGETVIPPTPHIDSVNIDTAFHKDEHYASLRVAFTKTESHNYYAVRVQGIDYFAEDDSLSICYKELETSMEPLLNNLTDAELGFGNNNDFFNLLYIFDTSNTVSATPLLHLNTPLKSYTQAYRTELYSLSPEFYYMMKSLNDAANNEMGKYGMAFMPPSYTNVHGGYGCVAGYGVTTNEWQP